VLAMRADERDVVDRIKDHGELRDWRRALEVLNSLGQPSAAAYEATVVACGCSLQWEPACSLLEEMHQRRMACSALHSYELVISACGHAGEWERALNVLASVQHPLLHRREGIICFNAALAACKVANQWKQGLDLIEQMWRAGPMPTIVSVCTAIVTCGRAGEPAHGLKLLDDMESRGLRPDPMCFAAAISSCCPGGEWKRALRLLEECEEECGPPTDPQVITAAMYRLVEEGELEHLRHGDALLRRVHQTPELVRQDVYPMHHALLTAYRQQGDCQRASEIHAMAVAIGQTPAAPEATLFPHGPMSRHGLPHDPKGGDRNVSEGSKDGAMAELATTVATAAAAIDEQIAVGMTKSVPARTRFSGTVKWWRTDLGYGFASRDDGEKDIFIYHRSIQIDGCRTLQIGDQIEFEEYIDPKTGRLQGGHVTRATRQQARDVSDAGSTDSTHEDGGRQCDSNSSAVGCVRKRHAPPEFKQPSRTAARRSSSPDSSAMTTVSQPASHQDSSAMATVSQPASHHSVKCHGVDQFDRRDAGADEHDEEARLRRRKEAAARAVKILERASSGEGRSASGGSTISDGPAHEEAQEHDGTGTGTGANAGLGIGLDTPQLPSSVLRRKDRAHPAAEQVRVPSTSEIVRMLRERDRARRQRDFCASDRLRDTLKRLGVAVYDRGVDQEWRAADGRVGEFHDDGSNGYHAAPTAAAAGPRRSPPLAPPAPSAPSPPPPPPQPSTVSNGRSLPPRQVCASARSDVPPPPTSATLARVEPSSGGSSSPLRQLAVATEPQSAVLEPLRVPVSAPSMSLASMSFAAPLLSEAEPSNVPSLRDQVHTALHAYAMGEAALLRAFFSAHGLAWDIDAGKRMVFEASTQIARSVEARGVRTYSLRTADGHPNETRISAVRRYLEKLVAKRAESFREQTASLP